MAVINNTTSNTLLSGTSGNDSLYNTGNHVTLSGGAGNDTIYNMKGNYISINAGVGNDAAHTYEGDSLIVNLGSGDDYFNAYQSKNVTVYGGNDNDTIGGTKSEKIYLDGGAGNDTIENYKDNVTISGGADNDFIRNYAGGILFKYASGDGNDIITNYDENDRISIKSGAAKVSTSGNNVVFTVGNGKITLQNAKGKTITYFDASGNELVYPKKSSDVEYNAAGMSAKLKKTYNAETFGPSNYSDYPTLETINAVAVTYSLKITGNKRANKITGNSEDDSIYGGAGADTILGGKGNDALYGQAGNDIFYYSDGDGNDVITDYSPSLDTVIILSAVNVGNPTSNTSGDVSFKIGTTGQITFKNCASKSIQLVDRGGNILRQHTPD